MAIELKCRAADALASCFTRARTAGPQQPSSCHPGVGTMHTQPCLSSSACLLYVLRATAVSANQVHGRLACVLSSGRGKRSASSRPV